MAYGEMNRIESLQTSSHFTLTSFPNVLQDDPYPIRLHHIIRSTVGLLSTDLRNVGSRDEPFEQYFGNLEIIIRQF